MSQKKTNANAFTHCVSSFHLLFVSFLCSLAAYVLLFPLQLAPVTIFPITFFYSWYHPCESSSTEVGLVLKSSWRHSERAIPDTFLFACRPFKQFSIQVHFSFLFNFNLSNNLIIPSGNVSAVIKVYINSINM